MGLSEFESTVVLIQFTNVNCGPCRAFIPFLNRLTTQYQKEDLDLVAIESYTKNTNVLTKYRKRTGLYFKLLMSEKKVNNKYNILGTPIFLFWMLMGLSDSPAFQINLFILLTKVYIYFTSVSLLE